MRYLIIYEPEKFTGKVGKNKAIEPVKIKTPDAWMLPDRVLGDQEIVAAFPELINCEILDNVELMPNKISI